MSESEPTRYCRSCETDHPVSDFPAASGKRIWHRCKQAENARRQRYNEERKAKRARERAKFQAAQPEKGAQMTQAEISKIACTPWR